MPTYERIKEDPKQATAIAAFVWSRGVTGPLAKSEPGDAARGEKLVRDRGCLGCHAANIGDDLVGNNFAVLLTGAVLTETVFAWPGMGRAMVEAINQLDYPVVLGGVMMMAVVFVIVNLIVDLTYGLVDPRVRYG